MTLIKSSIPLTVYRAESPLLANITGDAIRRFAFRSIDNVPEEKACGFVNCDDMFDTEWINSIPEKGHYMAFGFRVDVRRIAHAILKKHVAAKVREEIENLQTQGKKALSKGRKGEIREHCKNMLLSKTEPRPSMYGVAVNMSTGLVYVASTSKPVLELFEKCMESAFGGELERLYPIALSGTTGGSDHPLEDLMKDIYNVYRTLQTIARGDIDSKGNVQYYVFVLVDNDYAGRNVIKYLEKDALKAIECRDIFCINPIMPKDVNPHYEHIKKSLERENAPYKGLDWEMEDYISDRIWKIFINDECAKDPLLCKPKVCHDKIHRNLNDIQKGRFHDIINNSACYEDIENIVHLIKTLRIYLKIDRV